MTVKVPSPAEQEKLPAGAEILRAEGIRKSYDGHRVLSGIDLSLRKGETLVIMGRSGSGKTTCLRILMGQERPDEGSVHLFGRPVGRIPAKEMNALRRRFGVVFQSGALLNSLTVADNVALPLRELTKLDEKVIRIIVKMKLDQVGLLGFEHLMPAQLSGGMKQRVGIARALALDPELLFYDEPTSGLDPVMTAVITKLIRDISRLGVGSVVVTHDMKSALAVADRLVMLYMGEIVAEGTPDEIRATQDPLVRQFVDGRAEGPIPLQTARVDLLEDLLGGG